MKSLFGYIIVNKPEMKFKEFDLYHAYYCGLCRSLKKCYGMAGQISLSYDMTFLAMLLCGLPASGVVDYPTWYKIQDIYVAVTRIAELQ